MTIAGSKIARSETTATIDWKVDRSPMSGMNCLGRLSRDSGQTRVPEPPHMITGWILLIDLPRISPAGPPGRRLLREDHPTGNPKAYDFAVRLVFGPRSAKAAIPAAASARASAKATKATGREKLCAIAPVASGAGRRLSVLKSDAEDRPTAGRAPDWRAARAKLQGTIAPVPIPMRAKPATLRANPPPAATTANPAAAAANDPTMIRWSLIRSRITSALTLSVAWQPAKKAAPRPAIAASFGASARSNRVDHSKAAVSAAIDTPMTIPSPIKAGAKESPCAPDGNTTVAPSASPRA